MKSVNINIYEFKELDKKIQEKIIEKFVDNEQFDMLSDVLHNELTMLLPQFGFKSISKIDLNYSLSNCQGDGVCFMGEFLYEKDNQKLFINKNSYHYSHYNTVNISIVNATTGDEINEEIEENAFKDMYKKICNKLEKAGYDYINDVTDEKNIIERIEGNNYEFYQDGRIFNG